MKIAVTYENGNVFQHFGHTENFKIFDTEANKSEIVPTNGSGHGALADFLKNHGVSVLICGGIGGGAKTALAEAGIELFGGVTGNADEAIRSYLNKSLIFNSDITCSHHDNHEGGHNCGSHSCSDHKCGE